uniref:C3H1-type domain-containing protein n=1 Tax=Panagrolaimus davidi TaxID=227884 RepID=A0A914PZ98_9BILA
MPYFPNGCQPSSPFSHHPDQQISPPSMKSSKWDENFMSKLSQQNFMEQIFNNGFISPQQTYSLPSVEAANRPAGMSQKSGTKFEKSLTQRVFFRTLLWSIKHITRFCSNKSRSWKNPFLYKTSLCTNWCHYGCCRFGDNCWYAHGHCDLRCFPRMNELPSPEFISQYLAHLGLPQHILDAIIFNAYCAVGYGSLSLTPEDPFASQHQSETVTTSNNTGASSNSMTLQYQQKPNESFNKFQPSWFSNTSVSANASAEETPTGNTSKTFSLFGNSYPSDFFSPRY